MPAFEYPIDLAALTAALQISLRSLTGMDAEGASSSSFCCLRWIEHSRSPKWTTLPWVSPNIWTSI